MKILIKILMVVLFLVVPLVVNHDTAIALQPITFYVSPNGNNTSPGTKSSPWKDINYAVSCNSPVEAGDTILVEPGTYTEIVNLGKSGNSTEGHITLKANGKVTIIDPTPTLGDFREGVIQSARKGYWVIDGFKIESASWAAIALRDTHDMIVRNNHTFESGASGIIIMPDTYFSGGEKEVTSRNIKVLNNKIERANWRWWGNGASSLGIGTQEALSIWGTDGFEVAYNTLTEGKREGIDAKTGSRNGSIHHNSITKQALVTGTPAGYNGGPALYVDGNRANSFNIDIYNNTVFNNTADAIVIADEDPLEGAVSEINIYNNLVYGNGIIGINGGVGIKVGSNSSKVTVFNNTVFKNVQSFAVDGKDGGGGGKPKDIAIRNNIFADSTYRQSYLREADDFLISNNLFASPTSMADFEDEGGLHGMLFQFNKNAKSAEFVDSTTDNFRLKANSPAVNIGSDDLHWKRGSIKTDLDNLPRKSGFNVDAGAFEFKQTQ